MIGMADAVYDAILELGCNSVDDLFYEEARLVADMIEQARTAANEVHEWILEQEIDLEEIRERAETLRSDADQLLIDLRDRIYPGP